MASSITPVTFEAMGADAVMILRPQASLGDSPHSEILVEQLYASVSQVVSCGIVLYGSMWGMVSYISSYSLGHPRGLTAEFWRAVKAGDTATAAAMEVFGRGPRWLRSPQPSLDDDEVQELRGVFEDVGVI